MSNDINNKSNEQAAEEWLTAAEFAERAGISTVAVYKRFKEGSEFFKLDDSGTKRFSSKALEFYSNQGNKQNLELNKLINVYETLINDYKTEIETLKTEINSLKLQITEKDNKIYELSHNFSDLAKREQELTEKALTATAQAQYLQAASEVREQNLLKASEEEPKKSFWNKFKGKK
ncbi:MAG: hypothetical protein ACI3ZQ_05890 [Candidatus Cryptobacteroides sp.]